jgi:Holliday junction resolvase-like predicted endonuclease
MASDSAPMKVTKSSRHSKITGDFAEHLVLYWLSRNGFECARVDHTGIDLIARNPHTHEVMGISVKGRSRDEGTAGAHLTIRGDNFEKAKSACEAFNCMPYFAIVVDQDAEILLFILSMEKLLAMFPPGTRASAWKMSPQWINRYLADPEIRHVRFRYETLQWWEPVSSPVSPV